MFLPYHFILNHFLAPQRAVREVYIWSKLRHPNIQELMGILVFHNGLGMVSPWMSRGNLTQHLKACPGVERHPLVCQISVRTTVLLLFDLHIVHTVSFGCIVSSQQY